MVQDQLVSRGVSDERVLAAMNRVPREEFVPPQCQCDAYEDRPLRIGFGQTISQPFTVAFMIEALRLTGPERVLEIGTGSGYAAAVLGQMAAEVHTMERIGELAEQAGERLTRLGYTNVHGHTADGSQGLPRHAPFDAIVVTAGANELPVRYKDQLADGGRIVIPIGETPHTQTLFRLTRRGSELIAENLGQFAFVPLIGAYGWQDTSAP